MTTTLALSDTNLSKTHPNLKTISNQAADNVNAGETSDGLEHIWCVAKNNAQDADLQAAIDWACGHGGVDCHGDCKLQFSTLVVARGNFTGNSRNSAEIVSKWNQATIAIIFILTTRIPKCPSSVHIQHKGPRVLTAPLNLLSDAIIRGTVFNNLLLLCLVLVAVLCLWQNSKVPDLYSHTSRCNVKARSAARKYISSVFCHISIQTQQNDELRIINIILLSQSTSNKPSTTRSLDDIDLVQKVFDTMRKRNVVAWNTIIAWYVKTKRFVKALRHFILMLEIGIRPTVVSFVHVFPAVATIGDIKNSYILYALLLKLGSEYGNDMFALSSAIFMYSELRDMDAARKVFDRSSERNIEVWNSMIGGYAQNDCFDEALHLFLEVLKLNHIAPDTVTFVASLTAVSQSQRHGIGEQIHAYVVKNSMECQVIISNALISMYSKCNFVEIGFKVFNKMGERDLVSWNTMVSAFVQNGFDDEALMLVYDMKKQGLSIDSITATALLSAASNLRNADLGKQTHAYLVRYGIRFEGMDSYVIDMYSKSGLIDSAERLFQLSCVHTRDHVTWNAMIAGYTQNGKIEQAFTVFCEMLKQNKTPNAVTLASILPACIPLGGINLGKQIHAFAIRHSVDHNVFVGTALIDMYSKCASIGYAEKIFNSLHEKNSITYTTMILGYGQHGMGEKALSMFQSMSESDMNPDAITFVAVLSACSYSALVDEGFQIFESMQTLYGVSPTTEHYCCVVDMLGRAGMVVEAYEFVKQLDEKGNIAGIWGSLLSACRIHGKSELGKIVADKLFELKTENDVTGYHVLLSNIYAGKEMWDSADRVRKDMREKGLRKDIGCSWIEIGGAVNCFMSRDQNHPQCDAIYAKLDDLTSSICASSKNINEIISF
ncbi:Pentatricopeptide repeat-containing protein [Thalictrum thalictroides]|uniref:Pentatricopeptide repeat-containing protein n=1 Tax=Thalictrum thalictroides TaxID=46969 RepID=A0A7J6V2A4_THATH|nr:Pentatricopeptide repeat-containing protein [Thalictrum thalictroides]